MKKKLLSILLVTATLLCFGCGGGSSSATNSGNSGGSANNSSDAKQTGDLYGTKKPVSATYTYKNNSYPMTFEFNDDGTYIATITWGITYVKLYFSKTGVIMKWESYDSSMQKVKAVYCVNGVACSKDSNSYVYGINIRNDYDGFTDLGYTNAKPDYDSDGNIANATAISEKDDFVYNMFSFESGDVSIERDADGRITKTSYSRVLDRRVLTYYTKYIYSSNSIYMFSYIPANSGFSYDGGYKVTYNSHNAISEAVYIKEDSSENGPTYTYTYDDYGFLTSINKGTSKVVTIEYTY